jgi:hypothetical protein
VWEGLTVCVRDSELVAACKILKVVVVMMTEGVGHRIGLGSMWFVQLTSVPFRLKMMGRQALARVSFSVC